MGTLKLTSWNVEHLDRLTQNNLSATQKKRRDAVVAEVRALDPDFLCVLEGPKGEAAIDRVADGLLGGDWVAVKADDGKYATLGTQWIWFLVRRQLADRASLLPVATWDAFTRPRWPCCFWGEFEERNHQHYRHPQVLVVDWDGLRVEFVGLHLKSKFVNQGQSMWNAGGERRQQFIREALTARIKMTTEATNVREYVDAKFRQVENPAIFVLGDLNDGPGKEWLEDRFLFFDLISNVQGDIFAASRYLNHALFDFPDHLRWSVFFKDFVEPERDPHILLDHIMFTQGLVNGSLPWQIESRAGKVEHEIHDLINAPLPSSAKTSDHKPVSVAIKTAD
ncbi:MAG TPA: endonuclease/exonuclease/phosphatase family protein [Pyrinomonadaceae bacterium]|nr:endonuclease/exonuclease/phosphatase family protein [Pyrinomonadaceae bacterium]